VVLLEFTINFIPLTRGLSLFMGERFVILYSLL
jgi:hypothetical protein